jgi:hypothetical protein
MGQIYDFRDTNTLITPITLFTMFTNVQEIIVTEIFLLNETNYDFRVPDRTITHKSLFTNV